jgi:protein ImuA
MSAFAISPSIAGDSTLPQLPHAVWRANQMGSYQATACASGYPSLDRELPNGGWSPSILTELMLSQPGIGELRFLAPLLASLTQANKAVILLGSPYVPLAAALIDLGIDLAHVVLIDTPKLADRTWAIEQTLKSNSFGAALCWLPQIRPGHLRRLQLAASNCDGLTFLFRPFAAQNESSPAPLRLVCRPASNGRMSVRIIKRRGPVHEQAIVLPLRVPEPLVNVFNDRIDTGLPSVLSRYVLDRPLPAAVTARPGVTLPA